ncbi:hypothetical protein NLJ89_g262 [Agrocybe chaxingu]|uniref:Uncharacterized protein n=1 Tax=Agrocybe chaxingu TaxID=84603 RepID=A0A9W8TF65_9AGAR|nr:hypothetical protein NLJ89_g262 [Agrocybe chaxingu]
MKFTSLVAVALLAGGAVAQLATPDVDELATRELGEVELSSREFDDELELSARELREDLVLRSLYHVKRQAEDHADLLARAVDILDNALYRRWGSGRYVIDDHTYHRDVKPRILSEMRKLKGFSSKCGNNPDFHVDRDGTVYPSRRNDKKGLCTRRAFSINMHDLLMSFVQRSRSPSPAGKRKRDLEDIDDLD